MIVQDQAEPRESLRGQVDPLLNVIVGLLGLALVIALIGIVNTLALSVSERTREIGLLRAVGMTRRQVSAMVRWEAVIVVVAGLPACSRPSSLHVGRPGSTCSGPSPPSDPTHEDPS